MRAKRALFRSMVTAVFVWSASAAAGPAIGASSDASVDVVDNRFEPRELTITAGTTVVWDQSGQQPHTVTADDGSFDSHPLCPPDCMEEGDRFEYTFDDPGSYPYHCKIHGSSGGQGMAGTIVVEAAPDDPSPPDTTTTTPAEGDDPADAGTDEPVGEDAPADDGVGVAAGPATPDADAAPQVAPEALPATGGSLFAVWALAALLSAGAFMRFVRGGARGGPRHGTPPGDPTVEEEP